MESIIPSMPIDCKEIQTHNTKFIHLVKELCMVNTQERLYMNDIQWYRPEKYEPNTGDMVKRNKVK